MSEPRDRVTGADDLSPKQLEAINLLATGMSQVAVAETIKIHRVTLSNWVRKDPRVRAELNRRIQERSEATCVRLQNLVETSLDVLEATIKQDRDPKAAAAFLRLVGSQGYLMKPSAGPATFGEAALHIALEEERQNTALRLVLAAQEPPAQPFSLLEELGGETSSTRKSESPRTATTPANGKVTESRAKNPRT